MPNAETVLKGLLSPVIVPGVFMGLMGLGVLPLDEKAAKMAGAFIDPIGIPIKPFYCVLGPLKVLGALALWGKGPLPLWFARGGLAIAALCGAYAHTVVGDSPVGPLVYVGLMGALCILDTKSGKPKVA